MRINEQGQKYLRKNWKLMVLVKEENQTQIYKSCPKNEHGFFIYGYVVGGLENMNSGTFGVVLLVKLENSSSWALCYILTCVNWLVKYYRKGSKLPSEVAQLCLTLCDPMDCSLPGSSVHGVFQARVLECVAIAFSRRSSRPRDWTRVSRIIGRCFTVWATREVASDGLVN